MWTCNRASSSRVRSPSCGSNCPRLRPGPAPARIEVEGSGIEVLSTRLQGTKGSETVWTVRVRAEAPPGELPLILRAVYAGGEVVEVSDSLTVVPGPEESIVPLGRRRRRRFRRARAGGWIAAARPRPPSGGLIASHLVLFQQFLDDDLGCASYLVGDEDAGVAAIVDPPYAIEPVLETAARRSVEIVRVGRDAHARRPSLRSRPARARARHSGLDPRRGGGGVRRTTPLEDGVELELGQVVLRAIHTPGHRPEHTCLAVIDRTRADEPWLVLTGDSLFVGDAARPDLAVGAKEGAEGLFHSLRRLLELPDGVEVFPGHVAGSLCGKGMSSKASSTIGFERRFNRALQIEDELDFVADASTSAPKPPNMSRLVDLNRGPFVGAPDEVSELAAPSGDAVVLDVRDASAYGAGHRAAGR